MDEMKRQVGGDHYLKMKIQPWEIIDALGLNFYEGNILKYLVRKKPGVDRVTDLKKLIHCTEHLIALIEDSSSHNNSFRNTTVTNGPFTLPPL